MARPEGDHRRLDNVHQKSGSLLNCFSTSAPSSDLTAVPPARGTVQSPHPRFFLMPKRETRRPSGCQMAERSSTKSARSSERTSRGEFPSGVTTWSFGKFGIKAVLYI